MKIFSNDVRNLLKMYKELKLKKIIIIINFSFSFYSNHLLFDYQRKKSNWTRSIAIRM